MALASVTSPKCSVERERDIEAGTSILHQRALTEKLLKSFGFWQYSKPTKTPQAPGTRLSAADKPDTPDPFCTADIELS
jgi:hypothetical protein